MTPALDASEWIVLQRRSKETEIDLALNLLGQGQFRGTTGIGFLDHMLGALCFYSEVDLNLSMTADFHVDQHHGVEDLGIVFGKALRQAFTAHQPIARFGEVTQAMDEGLVRAVLDVSGRAYLGWGMPDLGERIGTLEAEVLKEFFLALVQNAQICLHLDALKVGNRHHVVEAAFKAFGRALKQAKMPLKISNTTDGNRPPFCETPTALSTKGLID